MDDLLHLGDLIAQPDPNKNLRKGIVTAVHGTYPPTLDVQIGGASTSVPRVAYLSSYIPTVGDAVWLYKQDSMIIVLGHQISRYEYGMGPRDEFWTVSDTYNGTAYSIIYSPAFQTVPVNLITLVGAGNLLASIILGSETVTGFAIRIFDITTGTQAAPGTSFKLNIHSNGY